MEKLFNQLKEIDELLEQISTITANQTTILLQPFDEVEEQFKLIETMVDYKEELISQLEQVEKKFDEEYKKNKEYVNNRAYIIKFKECVTNILEKKKKIQEIEINNVRIMQDRGRQVVEHVSISKAPKDVVAAYKKQQAKS